MVFVISTIFFYSFCVSTVLVYGAGLGQLFPGSGKNTVLLVQWGKLLAVSMGASLFMWPLVQLFLTPFGMGELYPFLCVFVVIGLEKLFDAVMGMFSKPVPFQSIIILPCVIFTLNESIVFADVFVISVGCCVSFVIISLFLMAFKKRLEFKDSVRDMRNGPLLLISIGFLLLAFFAWNVSWWNHGAAG